MIIRLKKADFSTNNIGSLDTWPIYIQTDAGVKYSGPNFVKKNGAYTGIFTVIPGYEIDVDQIEATMDGKTLSSEVVATKDKVTITISAVIKTLYIHIPTVSVDIPTSTIWYIKSLQELQNSDNDIETNGVELSTGYTWAFQESLNNKLIGKTINTIEMLVHTSGIFHIGKLNWNTKEISSIRELTVEGDNEIRTLTFADMTIDDNEFFVWNATDYAETEASTWYVLKDKLDSSVVETSGWYWLESGSWKAFGTHQLVATMNIGYTA